MAANEETQRLALQTYLIFGAASGAAMLIGSFLLGWAAMANIVAREMEQAFIQGYGQRNLILGYLAAMPLIALVIAALLGMRAAAIPQDDIGRTATIATLYGMPILWVNMAAGSLLAAALIGWTDSSPHPIFDRVWQMFRGTFFYLVFATGITAAFASFVATTFQSTFTPARPQHVPTAFVPEPVYEAPPAAPAPERSEWPEEPTTPPPTTAPAPDQAYTGPPAMEPHATGPAPAGPDAKELTDFPVDCPRCSHGFSVTGRRPLRIQCPQCGKSGTIP